MLPSGNMGFSSTGGKDPDLVWKVDKVLVGYILVSVAAIYTIFEGTIIQAALIVMDSQETRTFFTPTTN